MTDQELADLLAYGAERSDVEFKGPGRSDDKRFFAKIVRAVLALTNRRDGGVVLIGVAERPGSSGAAVGVDAADVGTWTADVVRDRLAIFAEPSVDVQVDRHVINGKTLIAITVREFADIPVLCRKDGDDLREGAIYVRSRRKPESVELPRQAEMRDLLELATEKRLRSFLATASGAGLVSGARVATEAAPSDDARFQQQREAVPTSSVIEKARSYGYWTVSISPATFAPRRIDNVIKLIPIMRGASVSYRGWPYPTFLEGKEVEIGADWIGFEIDSRIHLDAWRLYQSGLFTQVMAFWEDWFVQDPMAHGEVIPQQGGTLGVDLAVGTLMEIFDFASRLAMSAAGAAAMNIHIGAHGLAGRSLTLPTNRVPFSTPRVAKLPEFIFDPILVERESLVASSDTLAADAARELFRRFGWDAPLVQLQDMMAKFRQRW